ncbi:MAG: hypothetical protein ACP5RE_04080 [Candidatus Acidifodinimicrobium sp.]
MYSKKNNLKKLITLATALAFIVPALVTASVVVDYQINYKASNVNPNVFLTEGPNYATANGQGLIYVNNTTSISSYTAIENNAQLKFNSTSYSSYTILLNVLELVSTTSSGTKVWINGSLPSGVSIYVTSSEETFSGSVLSLGTAYTLGNAISLPGNSVEYITFYISGQIPATGNIGSLSVQYLVN